MAGFWQNVHVLMHDFNKNNVARFRCDSYLFALANTVCCVHSLNPTTETEHLLLNDNRCDVINYRRKNLLTYPANDDIAPSVRGQLDTQSYS